MVDRITNNSKRRVMVLGAGKIGSTIANLLHHTGDYEVLVADKDIETLDRLRMHLNLATQQLDLTNVNALVKHFAGQQYVVSAGPYTVNPVIAQAALQAGVSYFDLTEDRATTQIVREVAVQAQPGQVFMPQCGLAPGFIGILAADMCQRFDQLQDVKMRVGALPKFPSNMLMYNLTWSTDGLINEYCNLSEVIHEGERREVLPLGELETFSLDGINYEAFHTSGGLGTLCQTLEGKVYNLNYKTVRYKGHEYLIRFLLRDLRLSNRRDILKDILENAIPITLQDVVLIFCTVSGWQEGRLTQISDSRKIYDQQINGEHWSAIQVTTASSLCAVLDLHAAGELPQQGFICQEQVPLQPFLNNRFGRYYISKSE